MLPQDLSSLKKHVVDAYQLGHDIALDHCIYGPTADAQRGYVGETSSYYRLLAGHCAMTNASRVIEVGTHYGGSSLAMAAGMAHAGTADCRLVTMDVTDLNREALSHEPRIHKIIGDSTELGFVSGVAAEFDGPQIDLLYVDALKTPEFVLRTLHNVHEAGIRPRWMILDDVQSNVEMRRMWDLLESEAPESAFLLSREYPEIRRPDMGYGIFVLDDENSILSRAVELMGKLDLDASHFERSDDTSRFDKALAVLDQREFATTFPDAFVDDCKAVTQNTLYALAKSFVSGDGDIVDFSAFLGASTFALSEGLAANDDVAVKQARIHAFDGFEFTSPPAEKYIQGRVPLSGSTLALFYENVAERAELINACPKSLSTVRWCGRPIELLSVGKTPSPYINAHLMAEFVPSMMTGKSVLVSPEILSAHRHFPAYIFAYLSDHFDIIDVRNNDVIAGYRKLIPQEKINRIIENRFTPDERLDLVLDLAEKVSDRHFAPTFLIQAGRLALSSQLMDRASEILARLSKDTSSYTRLEVKKVGQLSDAIDKAKSK